jgi:hypothetical protein
MALRLGKLLIQIVEVSASLNAAKDRRSVQQSSDSLDIHALTRQLVHQLRNARVCLKVLEPSSTPFWASVQP